MIDRIIAIDPGPIESAVVVWDGRIIIQKFIRDNPDIRYFLSCSSAPYLVDLVIEQVASMGMAVGESVFETVYWSGIFADAFNYRHTHRIKRHVVKNHLCGSSRARDSNVRQALIDRFGAPGTKKAPGLTYGLKADLWQAFALAVTWWDQNNNSTAKK